MIVIDGSQGEGGGQILRTSLTLSAITGRPFELKNIRANRAKPGLAPQHLTCVVAAAQICNAKLEGAQVGSQNLAFEPNKPTAGDYEFDIGTAGATSLVLQTIALPLALAGESSVRITGGTHVPFSPPYEFIDWQWRWLLKSAGCELSLSMERAGFYPVGGGKIAAKIERAGDIVPIELVDRGRIKSLSGISAAANLPLTVAERQRDAAIEELGHVQTDAEIRVETVDAMSPGTYVVLLAEFAGGRACCSSIGAKGKRAEEVGKEAARAMRAFLESDGAIDPHLADQALLPLSLASGVSRFTVSEVTQHLMTNARVIEMFLPVDIEVRGGLGESGQVTVRATGLNAGVER